MVSCSGVPPDIRGMKFRAVRHLHAYGPLARSIEDLELCLKVIAGPDPNDVETPAVPLVDPPAKTLKELKVAWTDGFGGIPVSEDTKKALAMLAEKLKAKGCTVEKVSPKDFDYAGAWETYGKLMDLELGSYQPGFMRFMNYVFGWYYRKDVPFLSMAYPQTYGKYLETMTRRDRYVSQMEKFMEGYDVWICPVASTTSYPHIAPDRYFGPFPLYSKPVVVDGTPLNYLAANGCYTTIFNLTGGPVVVIPVGLTSEGMPIGAQLAGKRWRDMELLRAARLVDGVSGAYRPPPGY
jgi:amidase